MIQAIEQRRQTMLKVMNYIVDRQRDFFEKGVQHLKPLTLREVAEVINMHESTVSRVTNEKFVQTPRGVLPLKFFFSSGLSTTDGEDVSARGIKDQIQKLVQGEDPKNPLTDQAIVNILKQGGVNIARRTWPSTATSSGCSRPGCGSASEPALSEAAPTGPISLRGSMSTPALSFPAAGVAGGPPPEALDRVDVSVLVPAKDEAENLPLFMEQAALAFAADPPCATRSSSSTTARTTTRGWCSSGSASAIRSCARRATACAAASPTGCAPGYLSARGEVLVFYPADLQFRPEDIPRLVAPILAGESDMVTGYKQGKYEKAFVSRIYNGLSRRLFDVRVRDLNNVKAYRREVMAGLPLRPDWHRYMIVLAAAQGYTVSEIPVPLYPRHAGRSKFGIGRIPVGVLDMLAVWFELRFGRKPLLLFGMLGAALFALGVLVGTGALEWLAATGYGVRWVWTLVTTCVTVGVVLFVGGLLGEMIAVQRAELAELRRELDDARARRARGD
jgi:hypothetical protein